MTISDPITLHPAYADPRVRTDYDENGAVIEQIVGWDLTGDCNISLGVYEGQLRATVNTAGRDRRIGMTARAVTREQVTDFALKLLALVAPPAQDGELSDLGAMLAAADIKWGVDTGDGPSDPAYIKYLDRAVTWLAVQNNAGEASRG